VFILAGVACADESGRPTEAIISAIVCPANNEVDESVLPVAGWSTGSAKQQWRFERISIFNGKVGEREYELSPHNLRRIAIRRLTP
jgi:hypothetical protein